MLNETVPGYGINPWETKTVMQKLYRMQNYKNGLIN